MKRLFVRPEAQGHKVGRRLCERLMAIAAQRGYKTMRLDTGVNHDEALALYRSAGFRSREPYYEPPAEILSHLVFMEADLHSVSLPASPTLPPPRSRHSGGSPSETPA
jgi:ribosomal protein S18 acetylase RimI-like enzyme